MNRVLTACILVALVGPSSWITWNEAAEPHPWVMEALDAGRVQQTLDSHPDKLPPAAWERFDYAVDGLLRAVVTVDQRNDDAERFIDGHVSARSWLSDSPRLIAVVTPDQLADLLDSHHVQSIEPDFPIRFLSSDSTLASNARSEYGDDGGAGTGVWTYNDGSLESDVPGLEALTGKGVTVAVIDSGIDKTHPDFYEWGCTPNMREGTSMVDTGNPGCDSRIKAAVKVVPIVHSGDATAAEAVQVVDDLLPSTDHGALGHGTHVAGIVAGNGYASRQLIPPDKREIYGGDGYVFGVAPETDIVSVAIGNTDHAWDKFLFGSDLAWYAMAVFAMQWVHDHAEEYNIRVAVNAWACNQLALANLGACAPTATSGSVKNAVNDLQNKRVLVIAANGEAGHDRNGFDARDSAATVVNAYDDDSGTAAAFTRGGAHLFAPGADIWAARTLVGAPVGQGTEVTINADDEQGRPRALAAPYERFSGNSMAAAHVAGAAAILTQACPSAGPEEVSNALSMGADTTTLTPGVLDVRASLAWFLVNEPLCEATQPPEIETHGVDVQDVPFTGAPVRFTATADDQDGQIVGWQWEFGDGQSKEIDTLDGADAAALDHTYDAAGEYRVNLTIVDDRGARDFNALTLRVFDKPDVDPHGPIRVDVNCRAVSGDENINEIQDLCPEGVQVLGLEDLKDLEGDGSEDTPFILEGLEIIVEAASEDEPQDRPVRTEQRAIGIEVVDTGGKYLVIRDTIVRTSREEDPAKDALGYQLTGIRIAEVADNVRLENVFICGTQERPLSTGLEVVRVDGVYLDNITVCNTDGAGVLFVDDGSDDPENTILRGCHVFGSDVAIDLRDSKDGTIRDCRIYDNRVGIQSSGGDNKIFNNAFFDNAGNGNPSNGNQWNLTDPGEDEMTTRNILGLNGIGGNYWDNYDGEDVECNVEEGVKFCPTGDSREPDGFGDTPYGTNNDKDHLPLVLPPRADITANFTLETPDVAWHHNDVDYEVAIVGEAATLVDRSITPGSIPIKWQWETEGQTIFSTNHAEPTTYQFTAATPKCETGTFGTVELNVTDDTHGLPIEKRRYDEVSKDVCRTNRPIADFFWQRGGRTIIAEADCVGQTLDELEEEECAYDPDLDGTEELEYLWTFMQGDDILHEATDSSVQYTFPDTGPGSFTLTVTDPHGAMGSSTVGVVLLDDASPPLARFMVAPEPRAASPTVFTDESWDLDFDQIVEWVWDFDDGNSMTVNGADLPSCDEPDPTYPLWCQDDTTKEMHHVYAEKGSYVATLQVKEASGSPEPQQWSSLFSKSFVVHNALPVPIVQIDCLACPGSEYRTVDTLRFDASGSVDPDPGGSIVSYSWDMDGDGNEDASGPVVDFVYKDAGLKGGSHDVNLTVQDNDGDETLLVTPLEILNTPPIAAFAWTPDEPTTADDVAFEDESRDVDHGGIVQREWDFGDDSTSDLANPTHAFRTPGNYEVRFTVEDDEGATHWVEHTIEIVNRPPEAVFFTVPKHPSVIDTIRFTTTASDENEIASIHWAFGDGTTAQGTEVEYKEVEHKYDQPGTYSVTLTVTDAHGGVTELTATLEVPSASPLADFSWTTEANTATTAETLQFQDASSDPDGEILAWLWDFGDGATATVANPEHKFSNSGNFEVKLTVTDDAGRTGTVLQRVPIGNLPPIADPFASPATVNLGQAISFDANATDSDGTIIAYHWEFGDGAASGEPAPSHTYKDKGSYIATVTVTDDDGSLSKGQVIVRVGNLPPTSEVTHTPQEPSSHEQVTFTADATDEDGAIVSWRWEFGDGGSSSRRVPTHVYTKAGQYEVSLRITDSDGATHHSSYNITIANTPPVVDFRYMPTQPAAQQLIRFTGEASDVDGLLTSWSWDFGDGASSIRDMPEHRFSEAGSYQVRLTVTDNEGATSTAEQVVHVGNVPPVAAIQIAAHQTSQSKLLLNDESKDKDGTIIARHWDLGDGTTADGTEVSHQYAKPGAYVVTLTVTDDAGAESTTATTVVVDSPPAKFLHDEARRDIPLAALTPIAALAAALLLRRRS